MNSNGAGRIVSKPGTPIGDTWEFDGAPLSRQSSAELEHDEHDRFNFNSSDLTEATTENISVDPSSSGNSNFDPRSPYSFFGVASPNPELLEYNGPRHPSQSSAFWRVDSAPNLVELDPCKEPIHDQGQSYLAKSRLPADSPYVGSFHRGLAPARAPEKAAALPLHYQFIGTLHGVSSAAPCPPQHNSLLKDAGTRHCRAKKVLPPHEFVQQYLPLGMMSMAMQGAAGAKRQKKMN